MSERASERVSERASERASERVSEEGRDELLKKKSYYWFNAVSSSNVIATLKVIVSVPLKYVCPPQKHTRK